MAISGIIQGERIGILNRKPDNHEQSRLWKDALNATTVGWNLALPIFGGLLIGFVLDKSFGTKYIFTIGLMMMGTFIGFYNLYRSIQKIDVDSRKKPEAQKGDQKKP